MSNWTSKCKPYEPIEKLIDTIHLSWLPFQNHMKILITSE